MRRFAQVLRVFRPCFRGKDARKIRRELKRVMRLAGEVRNCDVALKLLSRWKAAETTGLRNKIKSRRRDAERALVATLKRWLERKSSRKWRIALGTAVSRTDERFQHIDVVKVSQKTLTRMAESFLKNGSRAAKSKASPAELHDFRIASKKFRYSLELFTPLYGGQLSPVLEKIKRAQTLLGAINDCESVRTLVSSYNGVDRVVAWLRGRQRKRIEQFRKYWIEAFDAEVKAARWNFLDQPVKKKPAARRSASEQRRGGDIAVA